jgi:hypothetical protein
VRPVGQARRRAAERCHIAADTAANAGLLPDRSPKPAQAAVALLDLALGPVAPGHYGELIRNGKVLSWPRDDRDPAGVGERLSREGWPCEQRPETDCEV